MANETGKFGLTRIGQIAINVHDVAKATAFYRDALGMNLLFDAPNMAFFDCSGVRLMLGVAEKPEFDHPSSIIYFWVEDIQSVYGVLSSRGVRFEAKPHLVARRDNYDLWMAFLRDIDNNVLALMSELPRT
jgi:catechol 2,3-dioxygenase-like lactoylglutathione lyase family enzyme